MCHFVQEWVPTLGLLVNIATLVVVSIYTKITARIARASQDQVEASRKPVIVLKIVAREDKVDEAMERLYTKQVPQSVRVGTSDNGHLIITNIGTGPALNLVFDFEPTTGEVDDPNRHARKLAYFQSQSQIEAAISPAQMIGGDYRFTARYESLSGKRYVTQMVLHTRSHNVLVGEDWKFGQEMDNK